MEFVNKKDQKKVLDRFQGTARIGSNMKTSELIAKVRKPTKGLLRPRKESHANEVRRSNKKLRRLTKRLLKKGEFYE